MTLSRRISDPVHGPIHLSDLEVSLLDTPTFQRLRNVRQLGLAYYVYPGADYSRFSHSIGVCHVAGRMFDALRANGANVTEEDRRLVRLAALSHDIGHYPFSHAMEEAIQEAGTEAFVEGGPGDVADYMKHEYVSREVLRRSGDLTNLLHENDVDPDAVASLFTREAANPLSNLVSSDLDADRVDFLLRTAHHTGLPYGHVDLEYLISQFRMDEKLRVCLTSKGLRAADHLLICRLFDYQQVAYHKTVVGLELVLKRVLKSLLKRGLLGGNADWVKSAIEGAASLKTAMGDEDAVGWLDFHDGFVLGQMRAAFQAEEANSDFSTQILAILDRRPPKLLGAFEEIAHRDDKQTFRLKKRHILEAAAKLATERSIPEGLLFHWDVPGKSLTKIGSRVAVGNQHDDDLEALEQVVHILDNGAGTAVPIVERRDSFVRALAEQALYSVRVYVLPPRGVEDARRYVRELRARLRKLVGDEIPLTT